MSLRTIQNPINLDVLASTYNTLEKGHQQAVDTTAAYITALGDLPVNEAERPYIQKHINSIQETLNNEKIYGNAYAALDDIKLLGAKISTDPGIKGRIKAEVDYQNYIKNLESNNKISDDTKEMYRDINKYYYEDKYDSNGNRTKHTGIDKDGEIRPIEIPISTGGVISLRGSIDRVDTHGNHGNAADITPLGG